MSFLILQIIRYCLDFCEKYNLQSIHQSSHKAAPGQAGWN